MDPTEMAFFSSLFHLPAGIAVTRFIPVPANSSLAWPVTRQACRARSAISLRLVTKDAINGQSTTFPVEAALSCCDWVCASFSAGPPRAHEFASLASPVLR